MDAPTTAERARWGGRLGDEDLHGRLLAGLPCLHEVDRRQPGEPSELSGWVRVAAWNIQRGRRPGEVAARLASCDADITLLSEVDSGMARTQNVDVTDAIATEFRAGYTFGAEFVELGLGDPLEQSEAAGRDNEHGLHGNAVVSRTALEDPVVIRLPDVGLGWFAAGSPQPRVGGRMAVVATVTIDGIGVQFASTHLENRTDAGHRAEQMEALLATLEGALRRWTGRRRWRLRRARCLLRGAVRPVPGARTPAGRSDPFHVARALRAVVRGGAGARVRVERSQRRRTDDGARRRRAARPRADQAGLAARRGLVTRRPAVVAARGLSDHNLVSVGVRLP